MQQLKFLMKVIDNSHHFVQNLTLVFKLFDLDLLRFHFGKSAFQLVFETLVLVAQRRLSQVNHDMRRDMNRLRGEYAKVIGKDEERKRENVLL